MNGEVIALDREQFGAFVAENRKRQGLTQQQLAQRLHITDKAVSKWERGLSYPDVTLLQPLAAVFRLSRGYGLIFDFFDYQVKILHRLQTILPVLHCA